MMRLTYVFIILLGIHCAAAVASILAPTDTILLNHNAVLDSRLLEFAGDSTVTVGIYFLKIPNPRTIQIVYQGIMEDYGYYGTTVWCYGKHSFQYDEERHTILSSSFDFNPPAFGELIHDATRVFLNDRWLKLEKTSYQEDNNCPDNGPFLYNHFCHIDAQLDRAVLSPDGKLIGGTLRYYASGLNTEIAWYIVGLWDAATGQSIILEDSHLHEFALAPDVGGSSNLSLELKFSPDGRFIIGRGVSYGFTPSYIMYDIRNWEKSSIENDAVFTSDSRWLVTVRDGLPSLINIETGKVIQQYKTDYPMITATFTPDDKKLYIATTSEIIYVFDSRLPTSSVPDWDGME